MTKTILLSLLLAWASLLGDGAGSQASAQRPKENQVSTGQFKLLTKSSGFILQFVSHGRTEQAAIPRYWLIPRQAEKDEALDYIASFHYAEEVSSFPIGNGRLGLHLSSYQIQKEGSAHAAAGRDVFLIFDPRSSKLVSGGIERGVTKVRVRSEGCFTASAERYFLADVDGDGLTDIGVVKEELQCPENADEKVDGIVGPAYKQHPVAWYVFRENAWKLALVYAGKFPEHYLELPLIGVKESPVDIVGCGLWNTCDRTKWPIDPTSN